MRALRYLTVGLSLAVVTIFPLSGAATDRESAGDVSDARVAGATGGEDWLVKGGSFLQQEFSPLTEINSHNVAQLGLAWLTELGDPMGLTAEPIVVDGVIYLSAPRSIVYAIAADSGTILWRFDPQVRLDTSYDSSSSARVNRGVAVWDGKVYVGTGDGRLVAIDAARGTQLWAANVVDARLTGITGAPRVARGKVFIGYNGADEQVRGAIAAFDAATGREIWRFWTVPGDPAKGYESHALEMAAGTWEGPDAWRQGGGTVWDPITFDPVTGFLLFGTSKSFRGSGPNGQETAPGAKLFSGCIVAVNADTGQYVWHYQTSTPQRQTENFHIVLADLVIDRRTRHVAMTVPRNGTFYLLDAASGELLSSRPMVQQGWVNPPAGSPQEHMDYPGVVVRGVEDCHEGGCFGAHSWWPMSYSPLTHLTYVPIWDRRRADDPAGELPMVGRLVAWDALAQRPRWSVEHPIIVNSGVLSTAGNLVFQGEGTGEFSAYNADSGAKLWSIQTGSAIDAQPVSFRHKGAQYVIVAVGWGGLFRLFAPAPMSATAQTKYGAARLLAFRLGEHRQLPGLQGAPPPVPRPPAQSYSTEAVARGATLADRHGCTDCHSPEFDGAGRWVLNGGIPDLRYMPPEAHRDWYAIVLGGSHSTQGMPAFGVPREVPAMPALSVQEAGDIHGYVIDRAWAAYRQQQLRMTHER